MKLFIVVPTLLHTFVALWIGLGFSSMVLAVESTTALTLLESYQLAQQHDAQIASARASRDAGREKLPQGRAGLLPSINLDANYASTDQDVNYNTPSSVNTNQQFDSNSYGVSLVQPLFRLQNLAVYRQAQAQVNITEDNFIIAEQNLILRVADTYFNVLIAEESLTAARAQTAATSRSLVEARRKFEVGTVTITDADEAQAGYDLARANEIVALNDLEVAKQKLKKIIGQMPTHLAAARDLPLVPLQPEDMRQWEKIAIDHSPVIRVALEELKVAQQEVARNRGERYPSVDLVASYTDSSSDGDNLVGGGNDTSATAIGIQLKMPLYSGGERSSKVRAAVANQMKAQEDLRESREQVALDTRQAYLTVSSGRLQVQAFHQAVKSSESSLKTTQRGYQVGIRTSLDVLNSQQRLFETRRDLANAKYNYLNSLLKLKAAVGMLSHSDVVDINRLLTK